MRDKFKRKNVEEKKCSKEGQRAIGLDFCANFNASMTAVGLDMSWKLLTIFKINIIGQRSEDDLCQEIDFKTVIVTDLPVELIQWKR